jgi:3-hydroxyacyl-CoA dehydrogenase / enoyl-CoA hydratase / 3-hydroxybutyryl-CoA epimerase
MSEQVAHRNESSLVQVQHLKSGVALVSLGTDEEITVVLTPQRMADLRQALEALAADSPRGVIITGPHQDMFTVGADVALIQKTVDADVGYELAREGQRVYQILADLRCPTVAAISGPCVGGGFELALACTYRLCSDNKSTLIGLPEVKLGIIPGFGGTQRLPRLVGLPNALKAILQGRTYRAKKALAEGLVDEIVVVTELLTRSESLVLGNPPIPQRNLSMTTKFLTYTRLGRSLVRRRTVKEIAKNTKGFYLAPAAALEACMHGLDTSIEQGYEKEARLLGSMIVSPECKALTHIFYLTEGAKSLGKAVKVPTDTGQSLVLGAGTMGAGIAGLLAKSNIQVVLRDSDDKALHRAVTQIRDSVAELTYLNETERRSLLDLIDITSRDSSHLRNVNFIIEAVVEKLEVKKQVLRDLVPLVSPDAIIATNTSSLSITEIAKDIPSPERVVGVHFFNPADKMPLVEIVRGEQTSDRTLAQVASLATKLGKYPIIVEDVPGFLVNRILVPYLNTAADLLYAGYSVATIDEAARSFGLPMGPFRLLDEVGLDVAMHVGEVMEVGYGSRMKARPFAKQMVANGRLGKKSGRGFYDFNSDKPSPASDVRQILGVSGSERHGHLQLISDALVMSLINEAVLCLDEGVAGVPGKDAARQIDLGSVMGIGFPPFRGGIIYYADFLGAKSVHQLLAELKRSYGERFEPCEGIKRRAENSISFYAALPAQKAAQE